MAAGPVQLSLTPDIAMYGRSETIEGLCLSIWGENPQTGTVNYAGRLTGLQLGLVNRELGRQTYVR